MSLPAPLAALSRDDLGKLVLEQRFVSKVRFQDYRDGWQTLKEVSRIIFGEYQALGLVDAAMQANKLNPRRVIVWNLRVTNDV